MESKLAKCPYYRRHEKGAIICEGISPKTQIKVYPFLASLEETKERTMSKLRHQYCYTDWWNCPIAAGLNIKYELEDSEWKK